MSKYCISNYNRLKQQLVSNCQGKLLKGILFLQGSAAPHKAAIMHQKVSYFQVEALKYLTYSPDLAPSDSYISPKETPKGKKVFEPH
jgi:hypothetical protein